MPMRSAAVLPALLLSLVWAALLFSGLGVSLRRGPTLVHAASFDAAETVTAAWDAAAVSVDEAAGAWLLTAVLSPASPGGVVLTFSSASLSAAAPDDYAPLKQRVVVPAGQTVVTVPVTIVDDTLVEGDEQFWVILSSSQATVTLGLSETVVTILDDDEVLLTVTDAAAGEADGWLHFVVSQSAVSMLETQVAYRTLDDTAEAVSDYRAAAGVLSLPPGSTTVTVSVAVTDDLTAEPDEVFTLLLENPTNANLIRAAAVGRIRDDDTVPALTVRDAAADESAPSLRFQVELSARVQQTVTVDYATQPGTATPHLDYLPVSGTLILPPGQLTATLAVTLFDNSLDEPDKTVVLTLANPTRCTLVNDQAVGVIRDDDVFLPSFGRRLYLPGLGRSQE